MLNHRWLRHQIRTLKIPTSMPTWAARLTIQEEDLSQEVHHNKDHSEGHKAMAVVVAKVSPLAAMPAVPPPPVVMGMRMEQIGSAIRAVTRVVQVGTGNPSPGPATLVTESRDMAA